MTKRPQSETHKTPKQQASQASAIEQPVARANTELEEEKLRLEITKLKEDIRGSSFLKWIGPITQGLALIGIVVTFSLGTKQLQQTRLTREDERFERAVARLGSAQSSERLTGLAGLGLFIRDGPARQESVLTYLVNASMLERDAIVRSAIEDFFDALPNQHVSVYALSQALVNARDRNRALLKTLKEEYKSIPRASGQMEVDGAYVSIPFGPAVSEKVRALDTSGKIIAALIRSGAQVSDLSDIYCANCIFSALSSPVALKKSDFAKAYLNRSDFSGADLRDASFQNADLLGTKFIRADLTRADLSTTTNVVDSGLVRHAFGSKELAPHLGANFACSNLTESNFAGRLIASFIYDSPTYNGNTRDIFFKANLSGADFSKAAFLVAIPKSLIPANAEAVVLGRQLNANLLPISNYAFSYFGDSTFLLSNQYSLLSFDFSQPETNLKPFPNAFGRDIIVALSSLVSAENLDKAKLPNQLKSYLNTYRAALSQPLDTVDCSSGLYLGVFSLPLSVDKYGTAAGASNK